MTEDNGENKNFGLSDDDVKVIHVLKRSGMKPVDIVHHVDWPDRPTVAVAKKRVELLLKRTPPHG